MVCVAGPAQRDGENSLSGIRRREKKKMYRSIAVLTVVVLLFLLAAAPSFGEGRMDAHLPPWLGEVQTYVMLPVAPERTVALHVSVNGVWAGIPGKYSVLPNIAAIQEEYGFDQRAFADACHEAGALVCASINGIEGLEALREDIPNLDDMACRNVDGEPLNLGGMTLMCTSNPDWVRLETKMGKEAIDIGADLLLLDTPMGASFISGFLGAGHCGHCMNNLQEHLEEKYTSEERAEKFGIEQFDNSAISKRIAPLQSVVPVDQGPFVQTTKDALLFRAFIASQEKATFRTRKALLGALHDYAKATGRKVAFCTNAADLGTSNAGGHWIRALMFADLVELFAYEQNNVPEGFPGVPPSAFPRGKWAAFHKLAHAVQKRRNPAVIHTSDINYLRAKNKEQGDTFLTWMGVQAVEAYATNGAYIPFYVEDGPLGPVLMKTLWAKVFEHNGFVQAHKDLYEGDLRSGSPLAFLFLYNERGRTIPAVFPSYLGLAQGFVEGNYPFDVVFAGDGHYVEDRLNLAQLEGYDTIVVPSPIAPTDKQQEVVRAFAKVGGTVVCQEPRLLGLDGQADASARPELACFASKFQYGKGEVLVLAGKVTLTETHDVGTQFYRQYTDGPRKEVAAMAEGLGLTPLLKGHQAGLVSAFPILQPEQRRIVVHLVNYDIDHDNDAIRPKQDIQVTLPIPDFLGESLQATLYATDQSDTRAVSVNVSNGIAQCSVPELRMGAALVISKETQQ
jgi:hypothetical protein